MKKITAHKNAIYLCTIPYHINYNVKNNIKLFISSGQILPKFIEQSILLGNEYKRTTLSLHLGTP